MFVLLFAGTCPKRTPRYLVLHLDRCVQGTEATLLGRGSAAGRAEDGRGAGRRLAVLPALTEEMCSREALGSERWPWVAT